MNKPKVLFIVDVEGWAYDDQAKNWQELLSEYNIDIMYLNNYKVYTYKLVNPTSPMKYNKSVIPQRLKFVFDKQGVFNDQLFDHNDYNAIVIFYSRGLQDSRIKVTDLGKDKTIICINNEKWRQEKSLKQFYKTYLESATIITGCNDTIKKRFEPYCNIFKVSQNVNPTLFNINRKYIVRSNRSTKEDFIVGWSGNPKAHNGLKNYNTIRKICQEAGVKLSVRTNVSREELAKWYNCIDAVLCCSISEGGPMMLLEAGACAVPIITTNVGLVPEIIKHEQNGLIISSDPGKIIHEGVQMINKLISNLKLREQLALNLHNEIIKNWTYQSKIYEIKNVLKKIITNENI